MDAKQVAYFLEVMRSGSFTAAAKKLYISVPGLVKTMDKLEAELDVQLFARQRTGVRLTPAGVALARLAPGYVRQLELIRTEVKKAQARREAQVEVCMTWGLLSFFPRNFLSSFVRSNPDVSLTTHNYALEECREALLGFRGAIGLYFGQLDEPELDVLFHRESPLVALMARGHPLAQHDAITLGELRPYRLVILSSDPGVTQTLLGQLAKAGCEPQIVLDSGEWTQALELISDAAYISFCLPPGDPSLLGMTTRPVSDLSLTVNFNMATLRGVTLSDAEKRFAQYVVQLIDGKGHRGIKSANLPEGGAQRTLEL